MSPQDPKRVTVKLKCPNPLFEEWLLNWKEEAVAKESKIQYIFNHALQSLRKYPLPLQSGRDCKILKGFGDRLCKMLDDKLKEHKKVHGTTNIVNNSLHSINIDLEKNIIKNSKKQASNTSKNTGSVTKQYIPQYGSGGYAILIALYKESLQPDYPGFLSKAQIIKNGKDLANSSFTKPDPGSRYTAWSSISTLTTKNLVSRSSHPPKFSLTPEGEALARKLYDNSDENEHSKGSNRHFHEIETSIISDEISDNYKYLGTNITSEKQVTSNITKENKNKNSSNITNNCKMYDIDIQDEFTEELLRSSWIPENNSFSVNRNKDVYNMDCTGTSPTIKIQGEDLNTFFEPINSLEYVGTSGQASTKSLSYRSLNTREESYEKEPISLKLGKSTFNKFSSTESIANVPTTKKENTLQRFASSSSVTSTTSTASVAENFVMGPYSFDIILYVDNNETSGSSNSHNDEILVSLTNQGVNHEVKDLKVGDFLWICRDRITKKELVLPYIVERKRMDDFAHSIKDKRYHEQKFRLKKSGIENLIYLVESHGKNQHVGLPLQSLYQAATNTAIQENFFIKFTENTKETVDYLVNLSSMLVKMFKSKTLASCPRSDIQAIDINDDLVSLLTFKELNESSVKNKRMKVTELFVKMLIQIKGMSVERALAITQLYSTPILLKQQYQENPGSKGEKLLSAIKYGRYGKSIGLVLSKTIYQAFTKAQY